ncbi:MAG: orotidine-5'-phosphate decarboxylase [Treponemataceae bacterium]
MNRLQQSCLQNGPLCIGLDTSPDYIPCNILEQFENPAQAVLAYNKDLIKACKPYIGCAKVQIAYYEAMGLEGLKVYVETLKILKNEDIPVISDIKRGDIADTAEAYAKAHFSGDFETDIITVNPYMGFDTLIPFTRYCTPEHRKGIFVLLRTSNPGMKDIENLDIAQDSNTEQYKNEFPSFSEKNKDILHSINNANKVFHRVGKEISRIAQDFSKQYGYDKNLICSPVGAVVGCTEEENAKELRNMYPDIFFLIPGYGAQGGKAGIAGTLLTKAGGAVNSSRGILCAWKNDPFLADKIYEEKSTEKDCKKYRTKLSLDDIVESGCKTAKNCKKELLEAKKNYETQE